MKKIELLIFDMDGLIFDTGQLAYRAYIESAKRHNYEVTPNVYYYLTGRTEAGIREGMEEIYGSDAPYQEWRDSTNHFKKKILEQEQRVYKKEGVLELLKTAKESGIKIALASSSSRKTIKHYFEIEGMPNFFDVIVAGDEVQIGKPDPSIFLTACSKSGISPDQAIVLEDSRAGIEAARRGAILSILVEDDITHLPNVTGEHRMKKDLSQLLKEEIPANYQFDSLIEVRHFLLKNEWVLPYK